MASEVSIRLEGESDHDAVRCINEAAFGQPDEAKLVDALRGSVDPCISLVAVSGADSGGDSGADSGGEIVGHIMFSLVTIEPDEISGGGGETWTALGLAPMAVAPSHQRKGIGSELIHAGLEICSQHGHQVVFVLGHPEYYPRFGFVPAPPLGLHCEYDVPDEVFMVAQLEPGAIGGRKGLVRYAPPFSYL